MYVYNVLNQEVCILEGGVGFQKMNECVSAFVCSWQACSLRQTIAAWKHVCYCYD